MTPRNEQFLNKSLPSSEESERCILGAVLIDNAMMSQAAETLLPSDFYGPLHRRVYKAMLTLFEENQVIDPVLLGEELKKDGGTIDSIGGIPAITNLTFGLPLGWRDIREYVEVVRQKKQLRDLIRICGQVQSSALDEDEPAADVLSAAQTAVNNVCTQNEKQGFVSIGELSFEQVNKIIALRNREISNTGLRTGLQHLDFVTDGFQPSDLIIIGGRPSMGKSALAGQIAMNVCEGDRDAVIPIFSLEMSKEQYIQRLMSSRSRVNLSRMRRGDVNEAELSRIALASDDFSSMHIEVDDTSSLNALQIRSKLLRLKHTHGRLDGVVIDFLQRMTTSKKTDGRQQEVSRIAQELKSLAKDMKIPVIALSSLSRECEKRQPPIPRMSDLRESGDIESEADLVAFVYREHYYHKDAPPTLAQFIIEKHRHGPTDTVKLNFQGEFTRFSDYDGNY